MPAPVTVIGEVLIDILHPVQGHPVEHVGGSPANVAVGLARLGHPTRLVTHFGTDLRGQRIADLMAAEGVQLAPASQTATHTPTAAAHLSPKGIATYDFQLDWKLDRAQIRLLPDEHIHTGSIAATLPPGSHAVLDLLVRARERATISYDPNIRPSLMGGPDDTRARVEQLIACSDIVKASEEDATWLYPGTPLAHILGHWTELGATICAITRGEDAMVLSALGEHRWYQPPKAAVVDTVGAGDSAMAGLLSGLLDAGLLGGPAARDRLRSATWGPIQTAAARALACAAITIARTGANPPKRTELGVSEIWCN